MEERHVNDWARIVRETVQPGGPGMTTREVERAQHSRAMPRRSIGFVRKRLWEAHANEFLHHPWATYHLRCSRQGPAGALVWWWEPTCPNCRGAGHKVRVSPEAIARKEPFPGYGADDICLTCKDRGTIPHEEAAHV